MKRHHKLGEQQRPCTWRPQTDPGPVPTYRRLAWKDDGKCGVTEPSATEPGETPDPPTGAGTGPSGPVHTQHTWLAFSDGHNQHILTRRAKLQGCPSFCCWWH